MVNYEKLWGGRFSKMQDKSLEKFTFSFSYDKRLFKYEVLLNIAHTKMLKKCEIIPARSAEKIIKGLTCILKEGEKKLKLSAEDIHSAIEEKLYQIIGEDAGYLHTAKSRNDQVATSTRMYLKDEILQIKSRIVNLQKTIISTCEKNIHLIIPGFTHLQPAQPVLLSHYLLAFFEMLKRDYKGLENVYKLCDVLPLGSGALAGTSFNIDRHYVAKQLKFSQVSQNSIDSVSDRDFVIHFIANISVLFMHLSRLCEDLIIWLTPQFSLADVPDEFATGSSLLPQKKNPDVLELIRGRTGRVYGHLTGILSMMKALPLSYNRDMQEDKIYLFETVDITKDTLDILGQLLPKIKFNQDKALLSLKMGFTTATDMADYLVRKKVPFRDAHHLVGKIVKYCLSQDRDFSGLTRDELKSFSEKFEDDVFQVISPQESINQKKSYGSTAKKEVLRQIKEGKKWLSGL